MGGKRGSVRGGGCGVGPSRHWRQQYWLGGRNGDVVPLIINNAHFQIAQVQVWYGVLAPSGKLVSSGIIVRM